MKAENDKSTNPKVMADEKDEMLSKIINDGFKEDGLSSNFTHQVMGKIDQLENSKVNKPLIPWWGWIIMVGTFGAALVLTILYTEMPKESTYVIDDVENNYNQYKNYIIIATIAMGVYLTDLIIKNRKKLFN